MMIKRPKGTNDILPEEMYKWDYVRNTFATVCKNFGYGQLMTPVFESTNLFERGVGDTTDVVQKEMYTFEDKGGRSITLRPEGTAGAARAYLEDGLCGQAQPVKLFYDITCYRHEKPQAGRLREFHQLGIEVLGADNANVDAEIIALAETFFKKLGLTELELNLNSIGCPTCRAAYNEVLKAYLQPHYDELCDTCKTRFEKNPLRILDCKSEICAEIAKDAPVLLDYICDDCREHFEQVKAYLDAIGISYVIDGTIVRGLDYYRRTVFEIKAQNIGAQRTVCGGGRYDGLIEILGGKPTPGMGFALGIERALLALETAGIEIPKPAAPTFFIAAIGQRADIEALKIVQHLRENNISAQKDLLGRSVKAQMKFADKLGVQYTAVLGDDEIDSGRLNVKNMATGETTEVATDALLQFFSK